MPGRRGFLSGAAAALLAISVPAAVLAQSRSGIAPNILNDNAQTCVSVANLTQYNWPVSIQRKGHARSMVGVKPREVMRYCAPVPLPPSERIVVTLHSSWVPLGECELKNGGTMEISRVPDKNSDSGERTIVKCYDN